MSKTAADFPLKYKFGLTTSPWSPTHKHTGDDWAAPLGTPIVVGNTLLGTVGKTGQADGPHVHVQKLVDSVYVDPKGKGLLDTIAFPARVIETGEKADTGKFVRILDANRVRWSYFHLSEIKAKAGMEILAGGENDMIDTDDKARDVFYAVLHEPPDTVSQEALNSIKGQEYHVVLPKLVKYKKWIEQNDMLVDYPRVVQLVKDNRAANAIQALKEALK